MTSILRDCVVLIAVNAVLGLLLLVAFIQDARARRRAKRAGSRGSGGARASDFAGNPEVIRGENSMNLLYTFYAVATLIYALTVQVADAAQGYKVGILVADYLCLTYLCFFNSWFRNRLIRLYGRIQKD